MQPTLPLLPGHYYHIYARGNNRESIFHEERNYRYFLQLYAEHIVPAADTFAYCLMKNHFHLLVRIKDKTSQVSETCEVSDETSRMSQTSRVSETREVSATQSFSNLLNAYAKAINKAYARSGRLFEERFRRKEVASDGYFTALIFYIHFNPQKHGFVGDFREWPWSSYHTLGLSGRTQLARAEVLEWFGGAAGFENFHRGLVDERPIQALIEEDLV